MDSGQSRTIDFLRDYFLRLKSSLDMLPLDQIAELIRWLDEARLAGRSIFIIGNGGSAATASHMACDLNKNVGSKVAEQLTPSFRVVALTDNVALITALANDLGYQHIFSEQLKSLLQPKDLVLVVTGSGNSPNILRAVEVAKARQASAVGILGFDGGMVREMLDACVIVPNDDYGYIEDAHLIINHIITQYFARSASE